MKNQEQHKRLRIKHERILKKIENKYPNFDFINSELRSDLEKYWKSQREVIYASVDEQFCKSDSMMKRCSNCNCNKLL